MTLQQELELRAEFFREQHWQFLSIDEWLESWRERYKTMPSEPNQTARDGGRDKPFNIEVAKLWLDIQGEECYGCKLPEAIEEIERLRGVLENSAAYSEMLETPHKGCAAYKLQALLRPFSKDPDALTGCSDDNLSASEVQAVREALEGLKGAQG